MQPEAKFKRKLVEAFEGIYPDGWYAYIRTLGRDGVPDLRFAIPGHIGTWVEAKVDDKPVSSAQMLQLGFLRAAGERAVVVRCRGMDRPKDRRQIIIGYPHNGDIHEAQSFDWSAMESVHFWAAISSLGNAL